MSKRGVAGACAAGTGAESGETPVKTVRILGTHGVPAAYGGFETAAENIALYLVANGWRVIVYCQGSGRGPIVEDTWCGIERVTIPIGAEGWRGTSLFDLASIRHASRYRDVCLTFGYNTAIFNTLQRAKGIPNVINMDGMEWTRSRWGLMKQGILLTNERLARRLGTHLIADHPEIERYLARSTPHRKISTITYGAHRVDGAPPEAVSQLGLEPGRYLTVICRPIPENSILEIVEAFSRRRRGDRLVVLGDLDAGTDPYHARVRAAASDEVMFPGAIYDPATVRALRFHSRAYLHGHTVGGTNPSLVEAMAAGNPVIAHDNVYNRWTAGDGARFFSSADDLDDTLTELLDRPDAFIVMADASRKRHESEFTWERVAGQYEQLLLRHLTSPRRGQR
jgi:glycosyltransferase involved in cell wall biosynthesis